MKILQNGELVSAVVDCNENGPVIVRGHIVKAITPGDKANTGILCEIEEPLYHIKSTALTGKVNGCLTVSSDGIVCVCACEIVRPMSCNGMALTDIHRTWQCPRCGRIFVTEDGRTHIVQRVKNPCKILKSKKTRSGHNKPIVKDADSEGDKHLGSEGQDKLETPETPKDMAEACNKAEEIGSSLGLMYREDILTKTRKGTWPEIVRGMYDVSHDIDKHREMFPELPDMARFGAFLKGFESALGRSVR